MPAVPHPKSIDEVNKLSDVPNLDIQFISDTYVLAYCGDHHCTALHILMRRYEDEDFLVGASFSCEQIDGMAAAARLILKHKRS